MAETDPVQTNGQPSETVRLYETVAKRYGVTVPMLRALEELSLSPGCTQKTLAETLGASKQRVNLLARSLAQKELLTFRENEADGRSKRLFLTASGETAVRALRQALSPSEVSPGAHPHDHPHTHAPGGEGYAHAHPHRHTKAVLDRLARCIGHLEKVRQMVEAGEDCSEVLIQLSAVKAAVNSTGKLILKDHIGHCLVDAIEHGDRRTLEELDRAIDQFIK